MSNQNNTYTSLIDECRAAGITLNEACRKANVDDSVVRRWKRVEPKTLRILAAVRKAIKEHNK